MSGNLLKIQAILATHNQGKLTELQRALSGLGWELKSLQDFALPVPEETGTTFEANALIKAQAAASATGLWALSDDSGLEVDALDGAPGVHTSEYGGWEKLLDALCDTPEAMRSARFVCVLMLVRDGEATLTFKGVCEGRIASAARGNGGFGYDPVFIPAGETRTFAEMTPDEKHHFSHRGQAVAAFLKWASEQQNRIA